MIKKGPIVIVDDDPDDQQLIQEALESLYITNSLLFFSQGNAVLQYLKSTSEQPFIIICDINMPGMTGVGALMALRKLQGLGDAIIVMLSTSISTSQAESLRQSGADFAIQKPVKVEDYQSVIRRVFSND